MHYTFTTVVHKRLDDCVGMDYAGRFGIAWQVRWFRPLTGYIMPFSGERVSKAIDDTRFANSTDVVIQFADGELSAHSLLLRSWSPVLADMLHAREANAPLQLSSVSLQVGEQLIRFMQTGRCNATHMPLETLLAANQ